jgi:hypothetical protein
MKPTEQIAEWADKLRDISALGLHFADNPYDRERYQTVIDNDGPTLIDQSQRAER